MPDAGGVALFACRAVGLRELLPARVRFEPRFVVAPRARRRAVHRLYLLAGFSAPGTACERCDALQEDTGPCRLCGGPTDGVKRGEAMAERVLTSGGWIRRIPAHDGLAEVGGVAARLRYPV